MKKIKKYIMGYGTYIGCLLLILSCATQGNVSTEPDVPFHAEAQSTEASTNSVGAVDEASNVPDSGSSPSSEPPPSMPSDGADSSHFATTPRRSSGLDSSPDMTRQQVPVSARPVSSSPGQVGPPPHPGGYEPAGSSTFTSNIGAAEPANGRDPSLLLTKTYSGKPISLDLMDADLRNVLRLIADITGTNMIIEPDVSGRVTLKVDKVPWDHILDIILSMNSLGHERQGNVIRIAREARLREELNMRAEALRAQQALLEAVKDVGELTTVYFTINYAQPAIIAKRLDESKGERGRVSIDERTNLVIYSDAPARIADARQLIARLDRPSPQVLIEARIVTLNSRASRELGINWNLNIQSSPFAISPYTDFQVTVPGGGAPTDFGLNIGRMVGGNFLRLDATIRALESLNEVQVIAAPNVMTLNNVQAQISQGVQIPYLQQTAEGTPSTVFERAVVELKVTPHITPDRRIRMKIDAKQDEPGAMMNQQVSIETRSISTELFVEDGEIVVIGGVMRDRRGQSMDGTPGLNRVPILGRLFKSEGTEQEKTQLLIFISPKVIDPDTVVRR